MIKQLSLFCLIVLCCELSFGQEWSPFIINDKYNVTSLNSLFVVFDGNSTNDAWRIAYASTNGTVVTATITQNATTLTPHSFTATSLLEFRKFNGAYFLATSSLLVISDGVTTLKQYTISNAKQIASVATENYLHAVLMYNGIANWVVFDTSFNLISNQTISLPYQTVANVAITENGGNVTTCVIAAYIQASNYLYCGSTSSSNFNAVFKRIMVPSDSYYDSLHLVYDGTQVVVLTSKAVGASNTSKVYITLDGQYSFLLMNQSSINFRVNYYAQQGLWYLVSLSNSGTLHWYRSSTLSGLTMAPFTVTNISSLIYNFASNGNDIIAISAGYNISSTAMPSMFIHNISDALPPIPTTTTTSTTSSTLSTSSTIGTSSSSSTGASASSTASSSVTSSSSSISASTGTSSSSVTSTSSSTGNQNVTITSDSTTDITTSTSSTSTSTTDSNPLNKISSPAKTDSVAIIAGVVGGVGFGIIVLLLIFIILFIRRRRGNSGDSERNFHESVRMSVFTNAKILKDIEIFERLGGGQFGDVYRGLWQGTTLVALKRPKSAEALAEIEQEVSVLLPLRHQNIVQFFGLYVNENQKVNEGQTNKFMVTEFMDRGSLSQLLTIERVGEVDLTIMAKDAAAGMQYLASQGIIHRDLALRNLLVKAGSESGGKYIVKVADFGMSKQLENNNYYKSDTRTIPVKWCPPETLEYGKFSTQSDVWAFGVVLWEMFSYGKTPYPGLSNAEAAEAVLGGKLLGCPENCPNAIYQLMLKCWNRDPEKRPDFTTIYQSLDGFYRKSSPVPLRPMDSPTLRAQYEFTGTGSQYDVVSKKGKEEEILYHL